MQYYKIMLYIFVIRNWSPEKSRNKTLVSVFPTNLNWCACLYELCKTCALRSSTAGHCAIIYHNFWRFVQMCMLLSKKHNIGNRTIAMANTILQIGLFCLCSMWSNWGILHCFEADVCRAKEKTRVPPTPPWRRPYGDQQRRPPGETRRLWWGKVRSAAEWNDTHCRYVSMQSNPSLDRVVSQNHQV